MRYFYADFYIEYNSDINHCGGIPYIDIPEPDCGGIPVPEIISDPDLK